MVRRSTAIPVDQRRKETPSNDSMMGSTCSSQRHSESSGPRRASGAATRTDSGTMLTSGQGGVRRPLRHSVSSAVPDESIANLYPREENYVNKGNGLRSPKPLAELAIDTLCRNLPLYDEALPLGLPQEVVDDIVRSLIRHAALNATTLRALRNCELRALNLANCRNVTDDWLKPLGKPKGLSGSPPSPDLAPVPVRGAMHVDAMDVEAQKGPEVYYGSCEESSHCSTSSFLSANEDHPMEDMEDFKAPYQAFFSDPPGWGASLASTLTLLDLRGSQHLTDRGLLQLAGLTHLEEVRLDHCHSLTGHGLLACASSHALRTVSLTNCRRLTDDAVINLSHLLLLENLFLGGCRCLTDRSLSAMADLGALRRLDVSRCDLLTDKGLESLEPLAMLEELCLGWCRLITDAGVDCLTRQPGRKLNLRVLSVARCAITCEGIDAIGRLLALEELDMNGCTDIPSSSLATALGRLENLVALNASYCPNILRSGLQGKISKVKFLDLRYSGVSNSHLFKFTSLPALEELNLDSCNVGDAAIAHLADNDVCPNLVSLDLADNHLTDTGMAKMAKFKKLTRLSLFYCNITNAGLQHLSRLENLEVLNLDSREITDEGLLPLQKLKKLKCLDIFTGRITDTGCGHLSTIQSLESLELCGGGVGDFGCMQLSKLENLESLNLSQNDRITNRGAAALATLTKLKALNLSNTKVNSAALRFFSGLVQLQSLALYGCRGIDDSHHLAKLQNDLPNLKCLRLNSAAEHDGMYLMGDSDVESNSTWSGSGDMLHGDGGVAPMDDDEEYSDFD